MTDDWRVDPDFQAALREHYKRCGRPIMPVVEAAIRAYQREKEKHDAMVEGDADPDAV